MSHTNTTPNYALPQFVTTDKPAWLTDINGAFSAIDNGIAAAKGAADAAQGDATQALTDAGNAATAAATADAKGAGAVASISDTFDPTTIYAVDSIVMYNSLLYKCHTAVVTPGPWSGSANWARITVEDLFINLTASDIDYNGNSAASALDKLFGASTSDFTSNAEYTWSQIVHTDSVTQFQLIRCGTIGILNVRFSTTGAIDSGVLNVPGSPIRALTEVRGAISSKDGKTGFIQYSGNTFVVRCQASSNVFAGSLAFPIDFN